MFPRSLLSLNGIVPAVILRSGTENLLTYKSLDASGGSVFRIKLGAAKGALIRAAASTQPFDGLLEAFAMKGTIVSVLFSLLIGLSLFTAPTNGGDSSTKRSGGEKKEAFDYYYEGQTRRGVRRVLTPRSR